MDRDNLNTVWRLQRQVQNLSKIKPTGEFDVLLHELEQQIKADQNAYDRQVNSLHNTLQNYSQPAQALAKKPCLLPHNTHLQLTRLTAFASFKYDNLVKSKQKQCSHVRSTLQDASEDMKTEIAESRRDLSQRLSDLAKDISAGSKGLGQWGEQLQKMVGEELHELKDGLREEVDKTAQNNTELTELMETMGKQFQLEIRKEREQESEMIRALYQKLEKCVGTLINQEGD